MHTSNPGFKMLNSTVRGWGGVECCMWERELSLSPKKNCVGEEHNFLFTAEGLGLACEYVHLPIWLHYRARKSSEKIIGNRRAALAGCGLGRVGKEIWFAQKQHGEQSAFI